MLKVKGFTLLEIMFAIAAMSIFTGLAVKHFYSKEANAKLAVMELRVKQTQSALDTFIQTGCKRGLNAQPNIVELTASGIINSTSIFDSPYNYSQFELFVNWVPPYSHTIKVDVGSPVVAQSLLQAASASSVEGTKLVWVKIYGYHVERNTEGAKQFRSMFEPECN